MSDNKAVVMVVASAPGFYLGPRSKGERFEMPLGPKGEVPTAKWFSAVAPAKAKPASRADEDLA